MSVMVLLILISLVFAAGFLGAFLWAVKTGQFDDKYTPSIRILFDEEAPVHPEAKPKSDNQIRSIYPTETSQTQTEESSNGA